MKKTPITRALSMLLILLLLLSSLPVSAAGPVGTAATIPVLVTDEGQTAPVAIPATYEVKDGIGKLVLSPHELDSFQGQARWSDSIAVQINWNEAGGPQQETISFVRDGQDKYDITADGSAALQFQVSAHPVLDKVLNLVVNQVAWDQGNGSVTAVTGLTVTNDNVISVLNSDTEDAVQVQGYPQYVANGGSCTVRLPDTLELRAGQVLAGWNSSLEQGKTYQPGETVELKELQQDVTFTPVVENSNVDETAAPRSVTYLRADGSVYQVVKGVPDQSILTALAPHPEDTASFVCWTTDDNRIILQGASFVVDQDMTLTPVYAQESPIYVVQFQYPNGGVYHVSLATAENNYSAVMPEYPALEGKTGRGWRLGGIVYDAGQTVEGIHADCSFQLEVDAQRYNVSIQRTNGSLQNMQAYCGDLVPVNVDAPTGYYLKSITVVGASGSAYAVNPVSFGQRYTFTMPAEDVVVTIELAEIPAGTVLVKFLSDGVVVDIACIEQGAQGTAPAAPEKPGASLQFWKCGNITVHAGQTFPVDTEATEMVFHAVWDLNRYQVTVDSPAGVTAHTTTALYGSLITVDVDAPEGYYLKSLVVLGDESGAAVPCNPVVAGIRYTFAMPAENVTIRGEFEQIPAGTALVKFFVDGSLYDFSFVTRGENGTTPAAPSKAGYMFKGWRQGGLVYDAESTFSVPTDADTMSFSAVWEAEVYDITYDATGGAPTPGVQKGTYNTTVTLAAAIEKEGYIFIGWMDEATGMVYKAGASFLVTGGAHFVAQWEQIPPNEYLVLFLDPVSSIVYDRMVVMEGETVRAPGMPIREGYTFSGWSDGENTIQAGEQTVPIYGSTTYYATWSLNRWSVSSNATNCEVILNQEQPVSVGETVSFSVEAAEDYKVSQVYLVYHNGVASVTTVLTEIGGHYSFVMPDSDVTIYAIAEQNVFSIFTEGEGLAITTSGNKAAVGADVTFAVSSVDSNYAVSNVYVTDGAGNHVPLSITLDEAGNAAYHFTMPASDVTIHGQREKNQYVVVYLDADNSLLGMDTVNSGDLSNAPAVTAPEGRQFKGWEILPGGAAFNPAADAVTSDLVVRAVYVGNAQTVAAGKQEHLASLEAYSAVSSGNTNSSNLLIPAGNVLKTETGCMVYFTVAAEYDYEVTGVAVVSTDPESTLVVMPTLRNKEVKDDGLTYYTYAFLMPAEDVAIDVYTAAKTFRVCVTENIPEGGTFTINGYTTTNLLVPQGEETVILVTPAPGYTVKNISGTYTDSYGNPADLSGEWNAEAGTYTFTMIARDVEIYVEYEANTYGIDIETSNAASYKPVLVGNEVIPVESLKAEETSKGLLVLVDGTTKKVLYGGNVYYDIPANGVAQVGTEVSFTVTEYTGYDLESVQVTYAGGTKTCPVTEKDNVYHFTVPADDVVITAVFTEETYRVTKDGASQKHGTLTMNGSIETYIAADYKDVVEIVATPQAGYQVSKLYYVLENGEVLDFDTAGYENTTVLQDALDAAHSVTFHMPASNVMVYAEYLPIDYAVHTKYNDAQGSVEVASPQNVGKQVDFTVTPAYGYLLDDLYVTNDTTGERVSIFTDTIDATNGATYYFTMPASSVTLTAEFIKAEYQVTYFDSNNSIVGFEGVDYKETAHVAEFISKVVSGPVGYHFVGWRTEDVIPPVSCSIKNENFVITKNTAIFAVYEKDEIDVVFESAANGTVSYGGSKAPYTLTTSVYGDSIEFLATPDTGYRIESVVVHTTDRDGDYKEIKTTQQGNTYKFQIPATYKETVHVVQAADVVVTVTFTKDTYTLTMDPKCESNGTIAINGAVSTQTSFHYQYQDEVTIAATPEGGYYVAKISVLKADGKTFDSITGQVPAVDTTAGDTVTLRFQMPAENLTYVVDYEKILYSIDVAATNGLNAAYGTVASSHVTAVLGDLVTLTVTEKEGYDLNSITVTTAQGVQTIDLSDLVRKNNVVTTTFVMPAAAVKVTAEYTAEQYLVEKAQDSEAHGKIQAVGTNGETAYENAYRYDFAENVKLRVQADEGYYVSEVKVVGQATEKSYFFQSYGQSATAVDVDFGMPAEDVEISVLYGKITYTIQTAADETKGSVTTNPADSANVDDIVTVTVTPKEGYALEALTVTYADGEKSCVLTGIGPNTFTFTMPAANVVVTATFTEVTYTATLQTTGQGQVFLNGYFTDNMNADYLDTVTVSVTPADGWKLASITVDGGKVAVNEEIQETGGAYTFTMPERDVLVEVVLVKYAYDMTIQIGNFYEEGHGAVTTDPAGSAAVGERVLVTADPDDGYRLESIAVVDTDGNSIPVSFVSSTAEYVQNWSFTMPASHVTITVLFTVQGSSYYTDVRTDDWFYDAVTYVTDRGFFNGVSEDLFAPYRTMTREMFVTVLGRMEGIDPADYQGATGFSDVNQDRYFAPYVAWAAEKGIVLGLSDTVFGTGHNVTREQMFTLMYRYAIYKGVDVTPQHQDFLERYTDRGQISSWAEAALNWCVGVGVARGKSNTTIDPKGFSRRAEAAQMFKNYCDKVFFQ